MLATDSLATSFVVSENPETVIYVKAQERHTGGHDLLLRAVPLDDLDAAPLEYRPPDSVTDAEVWYDKTSHSVGLSTRETKPVEFPEEQPPARYKLYRVLID